MAVADRGEPETCVWVCRDRDKINKYPTLVQTSMSRCPFSDNQGVGLCF